MLLRLEPFQMFVQVKIELGLASHYTWPNHLVKVRCLLNMTEDFSLKALVLGAIRLTLRLKAGCF